MAEGILTVPPWFAGLGYSVSLLSVRLSSFSFPRSLQIGTFGEHYQLLGTEADSLLSLADLQLFAEFHLPSRRESWVMKLRRSRYDRLKQLIPPCLKSSDTDAPVGTVLYPLGISSWRQLTLLRQQKQRNFFCRLSDGVGITLNTTRPLTDWLMVQERGLSEEVYLAELPSPAPDKLLLAEYTEDVTGRVTLARLHGCGPASAS